MKRLVSVFIVVTMLVSVFCVPEVFAEEGIPVYIDGVAIKSDVPAQIINDRTMVPLRAIFEALGAEVTWDDATRTAVSNRDGMEIRITIGENRLLKNGEEVILDVPAQIVDSRTLVPVRAIAESYDCKVFWDGDKRLVRVLTFEMADAVPTEADSKIVMKIGETEISQATFNIYKSIVKEVSTAFTDEEIDQYATDVAKLLWATNVYAQKNGIALSETEKDYLNSWIYYLDTVGMYDKMVEGYASSDVALREYIMTSNLRSLFARLKYEFTDEEILAAAKENYVRVKHILVKDLETAEKVISEINNGKSFEDAAKEYSLDGMDVEIGYVFGTGEMVQEFEKASFELEEGKMTGAVQSTYGYHIIKSYPLDEVSDYILSKKRAELELILSEKRTNEELEAVVDGVDIIKY
jgi:parvulin-like peptidyl-prolyl isomerase